jgi:hypothetical protein
MSVAIANSHRIGSIWAPPSHPPRLLQPRGMELGSKAGGAEDATLWSERLPPPRRHLFLSLTARESYRPQD